MNVSNPARSSLSDYTGNTSVGHRVHAFPALIDLVTEVFDNLE